MAKCRPHPSPHHLLLCLCYTVAELSLAVGRMHQGMDRITLERVVVAHREPRQLRPDIRAWLHMIQRMPCLLGMRQDTSPAGLSWGCCHRA
jgi:hypothetical protein